ncbi:MAG: hypothetical protein IJH67_04225 [Thermoguttaceae bacterium]|nr:hypothetical protein [Thermoguttaceae bacterium]
MTDIPKLLTMKEIAETFRVDKSAISRWITDEVIPREYVVRPSGNKQGCKVLISEKAIGYLMQPPPEEHANLRHYASHQEEDEAYQRLLNYF